MQPEAKKKGAIPVNCVVPCAWVRIPGSPTTQFDGVTTAMLLHEGHPVASLREATAQGRINAKICDLPQLLSQLPSPKKELLLLK